MIYPRLEPAYTLLHGPLRQVIAPAHPCADALLEDAQAALGNPLNAKQEEAFRDALTARLMLLWGPAGTGKTVVLAATVRGNVLAGRADRSPLRIGIGSATYNA